jgi:hypothetical protein
MNQHRHTGDNAKLEGGLGSIDDGYQGEEL